MIKTRDQNSCCIGTRADKSRLAAGSAELRKSKLWTLRNIKIIKKWTREEYKEIREAYYYTKYHSSDESNTKQTYTI